MLKRSIVTGAAACGMLLCMATVASAACGDVCKQKCARSVSQGQEPTQVACEKKWSDLNAKQLTELPNAAGQRVIVRRAHNYAECIKFGDTLGYAMDTRISYCRKNFPN